MPSLSQVLNTLTTFAPYSEDKCEKGIQALSQLLNARLALFTVEENREIGGIARKCAQEDFCNAQEKARRALMPLYGLEKSSAGEDYYEKHWQSKLNELGQAFAPHFGQTPDGLNQVVAFNFTEMVNEEYRPSMHAGQFMDDKAFKMNPTGRVPADTNLLPESSFDFYLFKERDLEKQMRPDRFGRM